MMHYVYILRSKLFNQIYIGSTNDLKKRFSEHNNGKVQSTKRYKPWQLFYYEAYGIEKNARMREKRLKHHGNAIKELKKRIGLVDEGKPGLPSTTFVSKGGAGFTIVELIVVGAIFAVSVGAFFGAASLSFRAVSKASDKVQVAFLLEEGVEATRYMRDLSWTQNIISIVGEKCFYYDSSTSKFLTATLPCTGAVLVDNKFKRTIQLWDVCRDDTSKDIIGIANPTCVAGSTAYSLTKKIIVKVIWGTNDQYTEQVEFYLSNLFGS
jgi:putative endonuclease